jgi:hypothetical protein
MVHAHHKVPGRSMNADEFITDYAFFRAVIENQESPDFEKERLELFGFID